MEIVAVIIIVVVSLVLFVRMRQATEGNPRAVTTAIDALTPTSITEATAVSTADPDGTPLAVRLQGVAHPVR